MKNLLILFMSVALAVGPAPVQAGFGFFRARSSHCCNKVAVVQNVQTVVSVQSVPVQVTFVPSQVLLNGQVTQYNASTPFNYSYQGSAIDPQAYAQQQQQLQQQQLQQQQQQQQQATAQGGNTLEARVTRMERLLEKIAEKQGISIQATPPPTASYSMSLSVEDRQNLVSVWQSCKGCHSPGKKGFEKVAMFDNMGSLLPSLPRYKIYNAIQSGKMPPDPSHRIVGDKLESMRKWVHEGLTELKY